MAAFVSYILSPLFRLELYLDGIVKVVLFLVVYFGWSLLFKPEAYTYSLSVIRVLRSKNKKKKEELQNERVCFYENSNEIIIAVDVYDVHNPWAC